MTNLNIQESATDAMKPEGLTDDEWHLVRERRTLAAWKFVYGDLNAVAAGLDDDLWDRRPNECWDRIARRFVGRMKGEGWGEAEGEGWCDGDVADFARALMRLCGKRLVGAESFEERGA